MEDIFDAEGNPVDPSTLEIGDVVFDENGTALQYSEADEDEYEDADDEDLALVGKSFGGLKQAGRALASDAKWAGGQRVNHAAQHVGRAYVKGRGAYLMGGAKAGQKVRQAGAATATGLSNGAGAVKTGAGNVANQAGHAQDAVAGFARTRRGAAVGGGLGGLALGGAGGYAGSRVGKSFSEEVQVELSKALTDDDRDAVLSKAFGVMDQLASEVSKAQQMAEQEREARLTTEFYEVAKAYTLPIATEDLAAALREAAELLSPESVEVVRKCLEIASDAVEAEYGATGGGDNSDVMSMVNAQVAKFAKSGEGTDGLAADFFSVNPGTYDEYLMDNPAQLGR